MASLAQPKISDFDKETTEAEDALWEAFADHLDTLTPEKRKAVLVDLRANAEAHGE